MGRIEELDSLRFLADMRCIPAKCSVVRSRFGVRCGEVPDDTSRTCQECVRLAQVRLIDAVEKKVDRERRREMYADWVEDHGGIEAVSDAFMRDAYWRAREGRERNGRQQDGGAAGRVADAPCALHETR